MAAVAADVLPSGHTGGRTVAVDCDEVVDEVVDSSVDPTAAVLPRLGDVAGVDEQLNTQVSPSNSAPTRRRIADARYPTIVMT
jgi:hypothetical protein